MNKVGFAIGVRKQPRRTGGTFVPTAIHAFALLVLAGGLYKSLIEARNAAAAEKVPFEEIYTKYEYRIPMRDGVKLYTIVFVPKDTSTNYPILLQRTPYNLKPYTIDVGRKPGGLPESYVREKFIFAQQDVRGRFASEGVFIDERPSRSKSGPNDTDESTDAFDTIDWLVKNIRGNNGNVGIQGISYLGFYAAAGMIDSHPALKAASPQAPSVDLFDGDDILHGGGFWLVHNFDFFAFFGEKLEDPLHQEPRGFDFRTPDGYRFFLEAGSLAELGDKQFKGKIDFWNDLLANINNPSWCTERDLTRHLKNVHAAVLTVGGWFDAEDLHGALKTYRQTKQNNPGTFNGIVMGPWSHGGWHGGDGDSLGPVQFHAKTSEFFRDEIEVPFFRQFLKGATNANLPEAYIFETGTDAWRKFSAWPPTNAVAQTLWLGAGGKLGFSPAGDDSPGFDEYVSDPAHPVPFTARITTAMPKEYMVEDQRFAATRSDVLVYQTEPLTEDVTLAGPVTASLEASTTGTDSDWVVKLIDVYTADYPDPDPNPARIRMGYYQQLVRGEPLRGKYRNGYEKPQPFKPGEITKVEWTMPDVCHTFRTGHRIMVQVQSSWFPLLDRNPQTFCDIYHAKPEDFHSAQQRVYHSRSHSSGLRVTVLPQVAP
ncbi:MAG TPA: CocE/NonD family hydrolase [Candidatus Limnocylindrales bacterium]|nr:CocE/NonD family hydrolase [Candidatus Limnocylindrales bacterium]